MKQKKILATVSFIFLVLGLPLLAQTGDPSVGEVSTDHPFINLFFNGLTAVGTLSVAILALFGPPIQAWRLRPILRFAVDPKKRPLIELLDRDDESTTGAKKKYYEIRIEVANDGKDAARNCRARVTAIHKQKPQTNDYFPWREFVPRHLCWAKNTTKTEESLDVLPKLPEYLVIGRLTEQELSTTSVDPKSTTSSKPCFGLEIAVESEGIKGRFCFIGEGTVVVPFLVYAANLRTYKQQYVKIFWDGKSMSDFGDEHFGVELLSKDVGDALVVGRVK